MAGDSADARVALAALKAKAHAVMGDLVVERTPDLGGVFAQIPRYVGEYLVATYGLAAARQTIAEFFPASDRIETLQYRLMREGGLTVLAELSATPNLRQDRLDGRVEPLGLAVQVPDALVEYAPGLLGGGLWGRIQLAYRPPRQKGEPTAQVLDFQPIPTDADLRVFVGYRREFSLEEWIDLWLVSMGYNPVALAEGVRDPLRVKLLLLTRLIPLVEPQYNLVEMGPRGTGKTYLYRNVTQTALVVSGGRATPADLFVNLRTGRRGMLTRTDAVVFDEVAGLQMHDDYGSVSILKDYMESGHFSRGGQDHSADASIVLLGNLAVEGGQPASYYDHLFQVFPPALQDAAIVDRIHAYLPGWELGKITPAALAVDFGWPADYVSALLRHLRDWPVDDAVGELTAARPLQDATTRDQRAVFKTLSGLVKLLFPDGNVPDESASLLLGLAAELRQRVHHQLVSMAPGEFPPKRLQFFGVDTLTAADLVRARALDQHDERLNEHPDVGEITALLAMVNSEGEPIGGDVQVIQSSLLPGNAGLTLTGFHGPAMEQSAKAAYHYLRDHRTEFRIPVESMENAQLAVHLVQIEQNREGPSAGLAFLLAMLSALTGRAVSPALAVTGEVALHGQILPVGGLIPKLYAALRHGRRRVIVPEENRRQVDDAPPPLRDHLEICLVATVAEAVQHAYGLRVVSPRWTQES